MDQADTITRQKVAARKAAGKVRKAAHEQLKPTAGDALAATGLSFCDARADQTVSGFIPYLSEIDTQALLTKLAGQGFTTCVPVVVGDGEPLEFRVWQPGEPTVPGRWDIPVPPESADVVDPDILLVPMLSFDRAGYRLGYGGGFYDRTLEKLRSMKPVTAIGVAYSAQEVDAVIRGEHDQPLDWILTERGVIRPEGKS